VAAIADAAEARAQKAADILAQIGVRLNLAQADSDNDAVGGPYIPIASADKLNIAIDDATAAFGKLAKVRAASATLPVVRPITNAEMTSNFGSRRDPFLGSLAFHAGIDFRSPVGTAIHPTAPGKVTAAGPAGGYGNMVEVDHGHGITTRYGHMSRILVSVGDQVDRNSVIGLVGSTGRSTGPHLHYETRINDTPINPITYLTAGSKLKTLLN